MIGAAGETLRFEPGANEPGLYESTDGGKTFSEVWNGTKPDGGISFGITDVALDPLNPDIVYASAFDAGAWRRDTGTGTTTFNQVFAPQFFAGAGTDRTMFALTVKNGHTRIYLTDGTANGDGIAGALASNFWRTDNANQPAATLLTSQAAGSTPPNAATHTFPASYPVLEFGAGEIRQAIKRFEFFRNGIEFTIAVFPHAMDLGWVEVLLGL